jgi:hypothetical protein
MNLFNRFFTKGIIIGIHGLSNKPPDTLLEKWWIKSIKEGLDTIGCPHTPFHFKSVYWADILYESPEDPGEKNEKSPLFLEEPYVPGDPGEFENFSPSKIKKLLLDKVNRGLDNLFFKEHKKINLDKYADLFVKNTFNDLDFYYNRECVVPKYKGMPVRDTIRTRLADVLRKYRHRQIMLIAHSMGSIISYDVLTQTLPDIKIHTFITIGSPLGMPVIIKKILSEQGNKSKKKQQIASPENIGHKWCNYSDLSDPVALIYNLAEDYKKNSRGVGPEDVIVHNNYKFKGERNAHKLYGYLRTPEIAGIINDFCTHAKRGLWAMMKEKFFVK